MGELSFHLTNAFPNRDGVSALAFGVVFLLVALVIPRGVSGAWDTRPNWLRLGGPGGRLGLAVAAARDGGGPAAEVEATHGRKTKPVAIGSAQITLSGGEPKTLTTKLNRTGASLLRRRRQLTASFTLDVVAGSSVKSQKSGKLVIKIQPPPRKRS